MIRTNRKRDKSLFRDGDLASLLAPLNSARSGMHFHGDLWLVNESHKSRIGATTSTDNKLTHFASNGALSVEDFLPLSRFKGKLFSMEDSSNHQ